MRGRSGSLSSAAMWRVTSVEPASPGAAPTCGFGVNRARRIDASGATDFPRRRLAAACAVPSYSKMPPRRTVLERAYDLAKAGDCTGVIEIKERLKAEGYHNVDAELYGSTISKALRRLCVAARNGKASSGRPPRPGSGIPRKRVDGIMNDPILDQRFATALLRAAVKLGAQPDAARDIVRGREDAGALYRAFQALGAGTEPLSIIGSLGDTLPDDQVVTMLEDWVGG